jgi:hypothetical protein
MSSNFEKILMFLPPDVKITFAFSSVVPVFEDIQAFLLIDYLVRSRNYR